MRTIWKFPIGITDRQDVLIEPGATILSVQFQDEQLCLWAAVDPSKSKDRRCIEILGTGNPMPDLPLGVRRRFIGTVQQPLAVTTLVWHIFELLDERS